MSDFVVHVIDDDEAMRDSLSILLESASMTVCTYSSANVFLEQLDGLASGCIVTDMHMPGMGGLELVRHLKASGLPHSIVAITGHGEVALAVEAMRAGAINFLEKPFRPEDLIQAVEAALTGDAGSHADSVERRSVDALAAEEQRRRAVQDAFSQYVAPAIVERVVADPQSLNLGGETRDMTILFADIRGFTAISETMKDDPQGLTGIINSVLGDLSDIIMTHGGTIDKYMGDCVMAFWGAPFSDPDHAQHAVEAAKEMLAAMNGINDRLNKVGSTCRSLPRISIGVGINSGDCVVGNMGSATRFDYSVLGDPVNVASRLVGLSKSYDVELLLGQATAERLPPNAAFKEIDRIAVRGRNAEEAIYAAA
jgi:class 3 adenylate cyclase/CheY-like chemotaxis protein